MNKIILPLIALASPLCGALSPVEAPNLMQSTAPSTIVVHNRVLAKVNGKHISVVDLMKRMDMFFYQEYPQLSSSVAARYQFYTQNWRAVLDDMIDNELIMADARDKKLVVSDGDVREELEELFGPNVVMTIDNFGMSFDEIWDIILTDLTVKRMSYAMVNNKAIHQVHPLDIRRAFEEWLKAHPKEDLWTYQVISFQSADEAKSKQMAFLAHEWLEKGLVQIDSLMEALKLAGYLSENDTVGVSQPYQRSDKEISKPHHEILASLTCGNFSRPVEQQNRVNQQTVYRIFLLKEFQEGKPPTFHEMEEPLKNELVQKTVERESMLYRKQLRQRFRIDEAYLSQKIPEGFQPFSLV